MISFARQFYSTKLPLPINIPQKLHRLQSFTDYKRVELIAGKAGDGGIAFAKGAGEPFGPPCGGTGGKGGDIYVKCSSDVTNLNGILSLYRGGSGQNGKGKDLHGAKGTDTMFVVPQGTIIRQIQAPFPNIDVEDTDLTLEEYVDKYYIIRSPLIQRDRLRMLAERVPKIKQKEEIIEYDMVKDGEIRLIARGGRGGQGNALFKTEDIRGPKFSQRGSLGRQLHVELELKTIADCGLVGLPNAGKSSFLASITSAKSKIADYAFTTINPYIGVVECNDFYRFTIADIPGLVKGASDNVGLGYSFLRHVERSKILVYVIDMSTLDPYQDFIILQTELERYRTGLTDKPTLVIANKSDLEATEKNYTLFCERVDVSVVPISAKYGANLQVAIDMMRQMVHLHREKEEVVVVRDK